MKSQKEKMPNDREAVMLTILLNGERFGRDIRNEFEASTNRAMPLGSLYVILDRMKKRGFLTSRVGETTPGRRGNRRTYYEISAAGSRALDAYGAWRAAVGGALESVKGALGYAG